MGAEGQRAPYGCEQKARCKQGTVFVMQSCQVSFKCGVGLQSVPVKAEQQRFHHYPSEFHTSLQTLIGT